MLAAAPFTAGVRLATWRARRRGGGAVRCGAEEEDKQLGGFLGREVEALLGKDENRALFDRLRAASDRVDAARAALADIERQEADAARADELLRRLQARQSEIAETEKEIEEARAMVEEAERSLTSSIADAAENDENINKDLERLESAKVAAVSAAVGTLASLPIAASQATTPFDLTVHVGVVLFSCALFGLTFRYAVRRDLDNFQLKTGTCAAFGFVKGLSAVESSSSLPELIISGAVQISESVFIFLFSAVALDFCFKTGLLSPFPIRK